MKSKFNPFWFPLLLLSLFWLVESAEHVFDISLYTHGVYPRTLKGLQGVIFSPFLHGDWNHLIDNSLSFLMLGAAIFYFYRPVAYRVFFWAWIFTGVGAWLVARPSYHIGASGMIYAFASFIFFSGFIRKYYRLIAISLLVVFLYGSMVWGVFPFEDGVSWESHLAGGIVGLALAIVYRKYGPQREVFEWPEEEEFDDEDPYWKESGTDQHVQRQQKVLYHFTPKDKEV